MKYRCVYYGMVIVYFSGTWLLGAKYHREYISTQELLQGQEKPPVRTLFSKDVRDLQNPLQDSLPIDPKINKEASSKAGAKDSNFFEKQATKSSFSSSPDTKRKKGGYNLEGYDPIYDTNEEMDNRDPEFALDKIEIRTKDEAIEKELEKGPEYINQQLEIMADNIINLTRKDLIDSKKGNFKKILKSQTDKEIEQLTKQLQEYREAAAVRWVGGKDKIKSVSQLMLENEASKKKKVKVKFQEKDKKKSEEAKESDSFNRGQESELKESISDRSSPENDEKDGQVHEVIYQIDHDDKPNYQLSKEEGKLANERIQKKGEITVRAGLIDLGRATDQKIIDKALTATDINARLLTIANKRVKISTRKKELQNSSLPSKRIEAYILDKVIKDLDKRIKDLHAAGEKLANEKNFGGVIPLDSLSGESFTLPKRSN